MKPEPISGLTDTERDHPYPSIGQALRLLTSAPRANDALVNTPIEQAITILQTATEVQHENP